MNAQNIHRTHHDSNFVILPNAILTNATLSGNAKALLSYLLSRPTTWKIRIPQLQNVLKVGRDRVYRYLRELVDAGYATMTLIQKGVRWQFFDTPQTSQASDTATPAPEIHLTETQQAERQQALERTYTSSLEIKENNNTPRHAPESLEPTNEIVVVLNFENEKHDHEIQQTEMASLAIETTQPAPEVLSKCDNAILDNRVTPEIVAEVEKLPITQAIKPTLIKTLAALTLIEAKAILAILSRAIVLGKVQNPVGYAVGLVRASQNGTLTTVVTQQTETLSQRIARQERERIEDAKRGRMSNDEWAKSMIAKLGMDEAMRIMPWYVPQ